MASARRATASSSAAGSGAPPAQADRALRVLLWGAAGVLVLFLATPLAAMIWRTWVERDAISPVAMAALRQALSLSLLTSAISTTIVVMLGTPI